MIHIGEERQMYHSSFLINTQQVIVSLCCKLWYFATFPWKNIYVLDTLIKYKLATWNKNGWARLKLMLYTTSIYAFNGRTFFLWKVVHLPSSRRDRRSHQARPSHRGTQNGILRKENLWRGCVTSIVSHLFHMPFWLTNYYFFPKYIEKI